MKSLDDSQVVITDGLTGNIILKTAESALSFVFEMLSNEIRNQNYVRQLCAWVGLNKPCKKIKQEIAYENYSTAPLLGIDGNVMICHGKSSAEAIYNAIKITKKYLGCNVNGHLREEVSRL